MKNFIIAVGHTASGTKGAALFQGLMKVTVQEKSVLFYLKI